MRKVPGGQLVVNTETNSTRSPYGLSILIASQGDWRGTGKDKDTVKVTETLVRQMISEGRLPSTTCFENGQDGSARMLIKSTQMGKLETYANTLKSIFTDRLGAIVSDNTNGK